MATHFADRLTRSNGNRILRGTILGLALCFAPAVGAQDFTAPTPRARQLMKTAREAYAKGDYEAAEAFYFQAAQAKDMLTSSERKDLEAQLNQNATALQSRREGLKLLKQAQDALAVGKAADAEGYLRLAQANQFLSGADRQNLASLIRLPSRGAGCCWYWAVKWYSP